MGWNGSVALELFLSKHVDFSASIAVCVSVREEINLMSVSREQTVRLAPEEIIMYLHHDCLKRETMNGVGITKRSI